MISDARYKENISFDNNTEAEKKFQIIIIQFKKYFIPISETIFSDLREANKMKYAKIFFPAQKIWKCHEFSENQN